MTLVVRQLSHQYGDVKALRGVDAAVSIGKITALLGPNASGKSTLLRCMIGAIRPTAGAVLIDGKPAHHLSAYHIAQHIAYVPQRSIVSARFTVREVVELGRYALRANRVFIDEAVRRLDLSDVENRPYAALSVGQQQRVTLARALAQLGAFGRATTSESSEGPGPSGGKGLRTVLILDEPMSAMDLQHVRQCVQILRELADAGVTIIIAMHDLGLAARFADDAWLLSEGRLVAQGDVREVLTIERLSEVFRVGFEWGSRESGSKVLLSKL